MKKLLFYALSIVLITQSCSQSDDFFDERSTWEEEKGQQEISFPESVEAYGKAVAKELRTTVLRLNEMNVDYSKADGSKEFREKFYKDWYDANPTIAKSRASGMSFSGMMDPTEFAEGYRQLTEVQLDFVQQIINECEKSTSYLDLKDRLITMKKKICAQVAEIEQERLLNVISVLYYAIQEISYLEEQGLMLRTPYNDILISRVKTRNVENDGSIIAGCTKFLTSVWGIAVGEPTPYGEVVASVVTVIVGVGMAAVMMYEVVTCKQDKMTLFCEDMYELCTKHDKKNNAPNSGGWGRTMCYECYHYCLAQGVWDCPRPKF